jgi:hypothetical protein
MPGETTTLELAAVIQTYIERSIYPLLSYNVVFDQHARLLPLPSGNTVRVPLLMPLTVIKSNLGETAAAISAVSIIPQYREKAIEFFGSRADVTKKAAKSALLDSVRMTRDQLSQQASRSVNRRFAKAICSQTGMRLTRKFNASVEDTHTGVALTSSTTTQLIVNTNLNQANARFVGGQVFFRTGKAAGIGVRITAAASASSRISFISTPLLQAAAAGNLVDITTLFAVSTTTSYRFNLTDVFRMAELARRSGAQGFSPGGSVREDGFGIMRNVAGTVPQLVLFLDSQVALDVMLDSATNGYADVFKQSEAGLQRWSKGQFGLVNNVSFIGHNEGWRMSVTGVESDTGVVHTPTLVGLDSYYATKFRGVGNERGGLEFRTKTPGPQTFSVNHEAIIARVEWDAWLGVDVQNGFHGVVRACGASTDA